ncbi:MAG: leucyl/phenylalanyl-tRNA--protein transferase [Flavobacteriaceae bacterium]|nr:leucyl/phenylalanyl-tRNA--protein transferase [Flavobacteriaceae bacterium]
MFLLKSEDKFPPIELANADGVLAVGGDLQPERLLEAYKLGIFPWYNEGEPVIWYSPPFRMVLKPNEVYISKSMKKILKDEVFHVTFNQNFVQVIELCQKIYRPDQPGTWITKDLKKSMIKLHQMGKAKSVEVWKNDALVGGLYGLDLDQIFCGESMFSMVPNASKVAFISLCQKLERENYRLLDCQVYNEHLESLGAYEIPRSEFKTYLNL